MDELVNNGFRVKYFHPHLLFIVWAFFVPQYIRDDFKKKTGYQVDESGNLINKEQVTEEPNQSSQSFMKSLQRREYKR
jgi:hypothetical protein